MKRLRINKLILVFVFIGIFYSGISARQEEADMQNPFGVLEFLPWDHSWNNYKYPDAASLEKVAGLMKEAGVGFVRMDFLWGEIEPQAGLFEFDKYDRIVDLLAKHNINILGLLNYSADWASSAGQWNYPPKENQLFVNYVVKVVERYKDKIKHWEVWNEPDSNTYWVTQDGLKSYCSLLKDTYIAIKQIDPGAKVLNGGFANGMTSVNRLYENGAKDYFDILNIHIFVSPLIPNAMEIAKAYPRSVYKIMQRKGDARKRIWITEIGCPGIKSGLKVENWWLGRNPTERQQAKWVEETYGNLLEDPAVEKVFWAFFRDCDNHWGNGTDYFGLVRWDYSRKPSFNSYRKSFDNWKKIK